MSGNAGAMRENLRQMIAVLQAERQALAGLDLDAIMGAANEKVALCGTLDACGPFAESFAMDEECRGLLDAARRMNEVNRQVRNLIAANVSARLDALTGSPTLYRTGNPALSAYTYAGPRG
ncbi:MAG TPA: flagellar protein FlgN [Novosphingobium sp.]|nr:flagellar protein FlgN [Novosphingobium sp.]HQA17805.1 flagellar protein FlgN [Novosphingobium sp.]